MSLAANPAQGSPLRQNLPVEKGISSAVSQLIPVQEIGLKSHGHMGVSVPTPDTLVDEGNRSRYVWISSFGYQRLRWKFHGITRP